jgi:SagB-type dehydrogenase family enzyme
MIQLALSPGVRLVSAERGSIVISSDGRSRALRGVHGLEEALGQLADGPVALSDLARKAGAGGFPGNAEARLRRALLMLARQLLIQFHYLGAAGIITAMAAGPLVSIDLGQLEIANGGMAPAEARTARYQVSRFACLHRVAGQLAIECPHRSTRILTAVPGIGAIAAALAQARGMAELTGLIPEHDEAVVGQYVAFMAAFGAIAPVSADGLLAEDADPQLRQREFHDVLMHMQSRMGLTSERIGGTFPFAGSIPPTPAVKPSMADELIDLPAPDLDRIVSTDPPLGRVMEDRRSVREHGATPLSAEQLGEFLFRVGRVRGSRIPARDDPRGYEATVRTYPSGGASYDLEIYLAVRQCQGLAEGFYHYEPGRHALAGIPCDSSDVRTLLRTAYLANGGRVLPQLLFVITSRFTRLSWKYRGIAYATTLRNVGVLYEAMYLAATAMGLAPCALGGGDSAVVAAMTSLSPLIESSVGEFMLGTRVPDHSAAEDDAR